MTKRRIRTLIRQGWTEVTVPRKNLYKYNAQLGALHQHHEFGDAVYMLDLIEWCRERFDPLSYTYSAPPRGVWCDQYRDCFKRFVFRNEADAVLFKLKWSE